MKTLAGYTLCGLCIFLALVLSTTVASSQDGVRPGPGETMPEYNRRYDQCNIKLYPLGLSGWTPEWHQCMRDSWAARNKSKSKPRPSKPPAGTATKPQDSGNLTDSAKVDPQWTGDTRKRIDGKDDDTQQLPEMKTKAPYGDRNCPLFQPAPNRGAVDWDWVKVTNRCSYPIAVIACYFDVGEERNCLPGGNGSWATIELNPGETTTSIATSKKLPWQVRGIVCNMTPQKNNRMLCVLPDVYRKS